MALVIAIVYFVALIIVASLYSRKKVKTAQDFSNAGGGMSWLMVTFCFVLAPLGSGHTLSLWQKAADPLMGASAMWWAIGAGAIFLPIAMLWIGPMYKKLGATTVPAALEKMYGKKLSWFHAAFQTMTWTGIGASETIATGTAIYGLSSGKIPFKPWCILIGFCLIVCYVYFGGMLQMAWLNVINSVVMIIGSFSALIIIGGYLGAEVGGWSGVKAVYDSMGYTTITGQFAGLADSSVWTTVIIPVIVLHTTAGCVSQTMMQPFFAAKDESACRKGVFLGCSINIMSCVPWVCLSLAGMTISSIVTAGGSDIATLVVPLLANKGLPTPAVGLLMISLLSATLSTGGGIVLANANVISNDIIKGCVKPDMDDRQTMRTTKICILVAAALLLIPALLLDVVFNMFLWVFSFGIPVFVCFLIAYNWKVSRSAAWITIIVTYIVDCIWTFGGDAVASHMPGPLGLNMYAVTISSLVIGIIAHIVCPGKPGWRKQRAQKQTAPAAE